MLNKGGPTKADYLCVFFAKISEGWDLDEDQKGFQEEYDVEARYRLMKVKRQLVRHRSKAFPDWTILLYLLGCMNLMILNPSALLLHIMLPQ